MIQFTCPACSCTLVSSNEQAGRMLTCGKCGQRLGVPAEGRKPSSVQGGATAPIGFAHSQHPAVAARQLPHRDRLGWYYQQGDKRYGPVSFATLRELAVNGTIQSSDLVWAQGMGQWLAAGKLSGLLPQGRRVPHAGVLDQVRMYWNRLRAAKPQLRLFVLASLALATAGGFTLAALLAVLLLPRYSGLIQSRNELDRVGEVARLKEAGTTPDVGKGRREQATAEEKVADGQSLPDPLKQDAEGATKRAAAELERLRREARAAEEKEARERETAEKLKRDAQAAEAKAEQERIEAAKARRDQPTANDPDAKPSTPATSADETPNGFSDAEWNQLVAKAMALGYARDRSAAARLAPSLRVMKSVFVEAGITTPSANQLFNGIRALTAGAGFVSWTAEKTEESLRKTIAIAKLTGMPVATHEQLEQLETTSKP